MSIRFERTASNVRRVAAGLCVLVCSAAAPLASRADAVSDQKAALKALGMPIENQPAQCGLLSMREVEAFLGKPVQKGTSAGSVSGCAWRVAGDPNEGLLVVRGGRGDWYPPTHDSHYTSVSGIGEKAYTMYEQGLGYEAVAINAKGVTDVQLSGLGTARLALEILRVLVKR